jgi:hypothetical protein
VVAAGGGHGGQVHSTVNDLHGLVIARNDPAPTSTTAWVVTGVNPTGADLVLAAYVVCARFTA